MVVALDERKVGAVRVAQADVALGEGKAVARAAAVEPLIWRTAHARGGDMTFHLVAASDAGAQAREAIIDDLRIGEADGDVISSRTEFLEVGRLADAHERIVGLLAVQSIGLQPLLAACNPVGVGRGDHTISALIEVVDHGLAGERRQGRAVRLVLRAGNDHADDALLGSITRRCVRRDLR